MFAGRIGRQQFGGVGGEPIAADAGGSSVNLRFFKSARRFVAVKVLFAPMYGSNPYQSNLSSEFDGEDVDVRPLEPGGALCLTRALVRHPDASVVHFHWLDAFYSSRWRAGRLALAVLFIPQLLLVKLLDIPVVWTVHNLASHETGDRIERPVKRFFIAYVCDHMILHCNEAASALTAAYDLPESARERMTVIPHGHYIDNYPNDVDRSEARETLGLAEESTVFLFFGEIRPYKNVRTLVETFDRIADPGTELLVAGRTHTEAYRREVVSAARSAERVVTRFGYVPDDEVQRYMNAADAVVLPFEDVLTSGSAVLAMSFGRPFVAPAIGCLPEIAGEDAAILYPADEPGALADAMRTAGDADLDAMGERGRERARRRDWASIAARTAEVYDTVA